MVTVVVREDIAAITGVCVCVCVLQTFQQVWAVHLERYTYTEWKVPYFASIVISPVKIQVLTGTTNKTKVLSCLPDYPDQSQS